MDYDVIRPQLIDKYNVAFCSTTLSLLSGSVFRINSEEFTGHFIRNAHTDKTLYTREKGAGYKASEERFHAKRVRLFTATQDVDDEEPVRIIDRLFFSQASLFLSGRRLRTLCTIVCSDFQTINLRFIQKWSCLCVNESGSSTWATATAPLLTTVDNAVVRAVGESLEKMLPTAVNEAVAGAKELHDEMASG